jgi:aminoglycoside 6'-N-acetyltransferase
LKPVIDIPTCIETQRLYLRPYRAGDGPMYFAVGQKNRDHLARYETENFIRTLGSVEEAEQMVQELAASWEEQSSFFMGAFDKQTDEFVAQIYIGPMNWDVPELELGFFVDCDYEGRGYVTEAARAALRFSFEHLDAHRVSLHCDDGNVRSARVAERCGMRQEGHVRENKRWPDGSLSGTLSYGMLRREFETLYRN